MTDPKWDFPKMCVQQEMMRHEIELHMTVTYLNQFSILSIVHLRSHLQLEPLV